MNQSSLERQNMKKHIRTTVVSLSIIGLVIVAMGASIDAAKSAFSRSTIDIGMVVSDLDAAARFYTKAIGFEELSGFDVSKEMSGNSGLTDYQPISVRVFALKNESTATRLKLMSFPDLPVKKVDNKYINSSLGYSYMTLMVADMTASVQRLKAAGYDPVKEPYKINANTYLTLVKDPDGNIIEFVGPKK